MTASNLKIFGFAGLASLAILLAVLFGIGLAALVTTLILVVIEVTFSFDNAIVNAKILERLSPAWQTAFLTIGIILAIFLVRLILPIVIVQLSTGLGFSNVVSLALDQPDQYADKLALAHPLIASFGGAFLAALALDFFVNDRHKIYWWHRPEKLAQKLNNFFTPPAIVALAVAVVALVESSETSRILVAGWLGLIVFVALKLLTLFLEKREKGTIVLAGWAGLGLFMYLQVLDASFSLDGVIGAFAITNAVLIIAAGLGIGALFVRSLTIYMVRRRALDEYKYLEHGAFYTILVLAISMFASLFVNIPDFITGLAGIVIIAGAIASSIRLKKTVS